MARRVKTPETEPETRGSLAPQKRPKARKRAPRQRLAMAPTIERLARETKAINAAECGRAAALKTAGQYRRSGVAQRAGHLAEVRHAASFNIAAERAGRSDLRAHTTALRGAPTSATDVVVTESGAEVAKAQLKYCKDAPRTAAGLDNPKYDEMQRIAPSDQALEVAERLARRGTKRARPRASPGRERTASDVLEHGGVKSRPLSKRDAEELARSPRTESDRAVRCERLRCIRNAALTGAAVSGAFSAARNLRAVREGEKTVAEAAEHVLVDSVKGAAGSAACATAGLVLRGFLGRIGAQTLARSSAPVAAAAAACDIAKDTFDAMRGKLDAAEVLARAPGHVCRAAGAVLGAKMGAALGHAILPGWGTILGGIAGALLGFFFGDRIADYLAAARAGPSAATA